MSQDQNYLDAHYVDLGSTQSTDSGDLEVVEPENQSVVYDKNYEDDFSEKKYFSEFSDNDRGSNSVYEGASRFCSPFESNKNEELPTYSSGNSPTNSEVYGFEELNHDSVSTKSKKKKDRASKSKKRKSHSKSGRSKKSRTTNHIINDKVASSISSKHIKRVPTTLSENSSDSDTSLEETKIQKYTSSYSPKRHSVSSVAYLDISEEDYVNDSYSKIGNKNQKKTFK